MKTEHIPQNASCCEQEHSSKPSTDSETITIRKPTASCSLCESYVEEHKVRSVAVVSCEGACLRGEISRQTANILCHQLQPQSTVRICSGSALTKDGGQRALLRTVPRILILEGCPVDCASRSLEAVAPNMKTTVIHTDQIARFDHSLFASHELPHEEIGTIAKKVAQDIQKSFFV